MKGSGSHTCYVPRARSLTAAGWPGKPGYAPAKGTYPHSEPATPPALADESLPAPDACPLLAVPQHLLLDLRT